MKRKNKSQLSKERNYLSTTISHQNQIAQTKFIKDQFHQAQVMSLKGYQSPTKKLGQKNDEDQEKKKKKIKSQQNLLKDDSKGISLNPMANMSTQTTFTSAALG